MCLLVISWQINERIPLALAGNRDEFHKRPTEPAHFWKDKPNIFAGRDIEAGGTWAGVSRNGNFAALTNIRNPALISKKPLSRGRLVSDFLETNLEPDSYLQALLPNLTGYSGFNLLVGNQNSLFYLENLTHQMKQLPPGNYGMSNGLLDTPWPKLLNAKDKFEQAISSNKNPEELAMLLNGRVKADDNQLPDTGVSYDWEKLLSSEFILSEGYGTRAGTGWKLSNDGTLDVCEVSFNSLGETTLIRNQSISEFWNLSS